MYNCPSGPIKLCLHVPGKLGSPCMVGSIELFTIDGRVSAPSGVVFSTDPRRAEGEDGNSYFIKGPELEIVFAELAGCELAREIGLNVPNVVACRWDGETYAGSQAVEASIRDVGPFLQRTDRAVNFSDLYTTQVVDVWLANKDRNLGNVIGKPTSQSMSKIELVFIDFEKAATLRPTPTMLSTVLEPRLLWPSGILGTALRTHKLMMPPPAGILRVSQMTREKCSEVLLQAQAAIGTPVPWLDDSVHALIHRANRIQQLAEEVWNLA